MDFAKQFNEKTAHLEPGVLTPAIVTIQPDRTFTFEIKTPPTTLLLKRAAGITKGSGRIGGSSPESISGTISMKHVYEIAMIKLKDVKGVGGEQVSVRLVGKRQRAGREKRCCSVYIAGGLRDGVARRSPSIITSPTPYRCAR